MNSFTPALYFHVLPSGRDWYGMKNRPLGIRMRMAESPSKIWTYDGRTIFLDADEQLTAEKKAEWFDKTSKAFDPVKIDWKNFREKIKLVKTILEKSRDKGMYLLGYASVQFDLKILNDSLVEFGEKPVEWSSEKVVDIMKLAEIELDCREVGSYSMKAVFNEFTGNSEYEMLRLKAEGDNEFDNPLEYDENLLFNICEKAPVCKDKTWGDLAAYINMPRKVERLTFGKFKGLTIKEVMKIDNSYLGWILRNQSFKTERPELVESIRETMKKDV